MLDLSAVDSQQLLAGLNTAVVVADDRGRIVYVNAHGERLLGWARGELAGRPLTTIIPERMRLLHEEALAHYLATRVPRLIGREPVRLPALRRDGTEVHIELSLSVQDLAGGRHVFVGALRDITEQLQLERERALARYLLTMREVAARLAAAQDASSPDEVAPAVLAAIGETLDWDIGGMWAVEGDRLRPRHLWAAPGFEAVAAEMEQPDFVLEVGQGIPGRVLATGEAVWIENLRQDANLPRRHVAERYGLRSAFAFPITTHGRVAAVVEFLSSARREPEPHLLPVMASAGAEIGRLVEREEARRQAAQAREHLVGMARALQASLLPPRPPVIPGLEVATRYRAAAGEGQVGGDFFDVFPLSDGGWAVAIGDVSGRGPEAAALTALARYTIRAAVVAAGRGSDVLRILNDVVLQELRTADALSESFLTVALLTVRPSPPGLSVQLACGGHPPPMVRRNSGEVEEPPCDGGLVGVFDSWETVDVDLSLEPGEALVLYTDGAFEGRGPDGEFGQDRLRQVLRQASGLSAEEVATSLVGAVLDYIDEQSPDDMAIVVLRAPADGAEEQARARASALTATG